MQLRQPRVAVLGSGSWGTTVASIVARSAATTIWARSPEVASQINEFHTNRRYLGDVQLHAALRASLAHGRRPGSSQWGLPLSRATVAFSELVLHPT